MNSQNWIKEKEAFKEISRKEAEKIPISDLYIQTSTQAIYKVEEIGDDFVKVLAGSQRHGKDYGETLIRKTIKLKPSFKWLVLRSSSEWFILQEKIGEEVQNG